MLPTSDSSTTAIGQPIRKVLIVEDHHITRSGLVALFESDPGLEVCGEATTVDEARVEIARTSPDVVSLDLTLGEENGLSFFNELRETDQDLPILCVSMHDEETFGYRAVTAGADGYIHKSAEPAEILEALHTVLRGERYIPKRIIDLVLPGGKDARPPALDLTRREFEVLQLIGMGKPTREIAERLGISPRTVEAHKENIKKKLNLSNAAELALMAARIVQGLPVGEAGSEGDSGDQREVGN